MPFNIPDSVTNAAHRSLALIRIVGRLNVQHYIAEKNKAGLHIKPLLDKDSKPRTCHLCGFALATLDFNEEWQMQSCSATGFKQITQPGFAAWLNRLSQGSANPASDKTKQYSDVSP
jgi:hypothetical protein